MIARLLLRCVLLLVLVALGAARAAAAEDDWSKIVAAAEAEGVVKVHGPPGRLYDQKLTEAFRKAYPKIAIEYSGGSGRDSAPRVVREYQAGIHNWDAYIAGTPDTIQILKPRGILAPLRPLLRADIIDDSKWFHGFEFGWMDREKSFVYAFDATVNVPFYVNWDFVPKDSLKTFDDLLKPEFAGKIVWDEPRQDGSGSNSAGIILLTKGADFLKRLLETQKIVVTDNRRQNAEWVVRGRYPIGAGTGNDELKVFWDQGLGKNVRGFPDRSEHIQVLSPGFGAISALVDPPHPNAARLFINWLLSADGQRAWNSVPRNSARTDVSPGLTAFVPEPAHDYIHSMAEDNLGYRNQAREIATQSLAQRH